MTIFERTKNNYLISTDRAKLNVKQLRDYIAGTYWSEGIPLELMQKAVENSLTFGVYHDQDGLIGCARVITDFATYHYLCDVFVRDDHRGNGLGKWLIETTLAHPELQEYRNFYLLTGDAHELYQQYGFETVIDSSKIMLKSGRSNYL